MGLRRETLNLTTAAFAVLTVVGLVLLRPTGEARPDLTPLGAFDEIVDGSVERISEGPCSPQTGGENATCREVTYLIEQGPDRGTRRTIEASSGSPKTDALEVGDKVLLGHQPESEPEFQYVLVDRQRKIPLLVLSLVFAACVVLLGGLRGLAALIGLAATLAVLLLFVLPSILDGRSPVLVSIVGAASIAFISLYSAHGFSAKTTVALLGTMGGLLCTLVLATVFMAAAEISGLASEEAFTISALGVRVDLEGLILGGMIIGALGAIDDMTVTQSSAVWELRSASREMTARQLVRAGTRIGRDHVASTVNTLVLAYAGASMPVLILLVLSEQSLSTIANSEILATEIVRTLVGSIGLVASVPITTWLAAHIAVQAPRERLQPADIEDVEQAPADLVIPERRRDEWFRRTRVKRSREK
jgi:uncharacterized membrane protein